MPPGSAPPGMAFSPALHCILYAMAWSAHDMSPLTPSPSMTEQP